MSADADPSASDLPEAGMSAFTGILGCILVWFPTPFEQVPLNFLLGVMALGFAWLCRGAGGAALWLRWTGIVTGLVAWILWVPVIYFLSE